MSTNTRAQDTDIFRVRHGTASMGVGEAFAYETFLEVNYTGSLTLRFDDWLLAVRGMYDEEEGPLLDSSPELPKETLWEVALMAGPTYEYGWLIADVKLGLSAVGGLQRGAFLRRGAPCGMSTFLCYRPTYYERTTAVAIGFSSEAEIIIAPFRHAGIGVRLTDNRNARRPYSGLFLTLHLGWLR